MKKPGEPGFFMSAVFFLKTLQNCGSVNAINFFLCTVVLVVLLLSQRLGHDHINDRLWDG